MIGAGGGLVILTRTFRGVLIRIESQSLARQQTRICWILGRRPQPRLNATQNRRQQPLIRQELAGITVADLSGWGFCRPLERPAGKMSRP